jgi:predicted RNase H-like nuclease (RuvC/YqgF family)
MSDAFSMLNEEHQQSKEKWKWIQTRLVADVESTTEENGRLKKVIEILKAETKKLKQERETTVRRTRQVQEELGPLKMELSVAVEDLRKSRTFRDA